VATAVLGVSVRWTACYRRCIGSSSSKRRKGREHPQHLPKVGTPAERAWEHETRSREIFGSGWIRSVLAIVVVVAIIGLILLAL
jgi:hypothetical protein